MKAVESKILIEEIGTDGHSPMKFICSDGSKYFVKYRSGKSLDKKEINCLVFEIMCTKILQQLHIPVPEQALVTILENSYQPQLLTANKKYLKPGIIAWGSKEIENADLVKEAEQITHKRIFNKLGNPEDLIRIAIFDLWVDNVDRHFQNYNLLTRMDDGRLFYYAIDHAFTFGGLHGMSIFNASSMPSTYRKLIVSPYFLSVTRFIHKKRRIEIADQFISLLTQPDIKRIINEVFNEIPTDWAINPVLKDRVIQFLESRDRIIALEQICKQNLQHNHWRKKS